MLYKVGKNQPDNVVEITFPRNSSSL